MDDKSHLNKQVVIERHVLCGSNAKQRSHPWCCTWCLPALWLASHGTRVDNIAEFDAQTHDRDGREAERWADDWSNTWQSSDLTALGQTHHVLPRLLLGFLSPTSLQWLLRSLYRQNGFLPISIVYSHSFGLSIHDVRLGPEFDHQP